MISDLITLILVAFFVIYGMTRPHIAMCGLIWINTYKPQESSYAFMSGQPISFLFTLFFLIICLLNLKKVRIPRSKTYHFLSIGFMAWLTISHFDAHFPTFAALKYNNVIKSMIFCYLIPFVIISRKHLEQFLWISVISLATFAFFGGVKSLLGGGGYGMNLIGIFSTMWSEGSILTNQMLSIIPVLIFLGFNSQIAEKIKYFKWLALGYSLCCVLILIGTQARSGLVCLVLLLLFAVWYSKQKSKIIAVAVIIPFIILPLAPQEWFDRMSTIQSSDSVATEDSAMGRVVVWRWAVDYFRQNPLTGGGFLSYRANAGKLADYSRENEVVISTPYPKAYHNILFEVTGASGFVGLVFYLGILSYIFFTSRRLLQVHTEDKYIQMFSRATIISMLVYCAGGMFVNYAFYPWIYYLFAATVILKQEVENNKRN
ncbi:putative O-glycosylation ligase, exosortase A system-associated [Opacimonas viscosa]|uniref:O-glycosylation ligase, exosortase A system-associated n=1 Tax=Opacimonas viscosa TaxID=2961944 RepID=A0AA41X249_9ALTE|nr:putative O-glycosylation ligase, exosortase A system-associated [Opacimonas viscosa]MCP3428492.1 putative O-glycosylation ligase, exosortase A system-associated [Opacimonas viscosa]